MGLSKYVTGFPYETMNATQHCQTRRAANVTEAQTLFLKRTHLYLANWDHKLQGLTSRQFWFQLVKLPSKPKAGNFIY